MWLHRDVLRVTCPRQRKLEAWLDSDGCPAWLGRLFGLTRTAVRHGRPVTVDGRDPPGRRRSAQWGRCGHGGGTDAGCH